MAVIKMKNRGKRQPREKIEFAANWPQTCILVGNNESVVLCRWQYSRFDFGLVLITVFVVLHFPNNFQGLLNS